MNANDPAPRSASSAVLLAADRLNVSRLHLQQALTPPPHASQSTGASNRTLFTRWLDQIAAVPAAGVVLSSVQGWWAKHPLRLALLLANDVAQSLIQPVVQKHPYRLVLGAATAGAFLVLCRPWRRLPLAALKSTLIAGFLPILGSQAISPLASSTWRRILLALTQKHSGTPFGR